MILNQISSKWTQFIYIIHMLKTILNIDSILFMKTALHQNLMCVLIMQDSLIYDSPYQTS